MIHHLKRCREIIEAELGPGATYVEVGSLDVNGAASYYLASPESMWTGIDVVDGSGVDIVGDAELVLSDYISDGVRFDVAVSTEGFEHMERWRNIFLGMQIIADKFIVVTCAAPPRAKHGATGADRPAEGEYYLNVTKHQLEDAILKGNWKIVIGEYLDKPWGDLNFLLRKQ